MSFIQIEKLRRYPETHWDQPVSARWMSVCDGLREYQAPPRTLTLNRERKWELTSALQKSIRRGDKQMALRLVSAMDSMPEEYGYFWRRLCVIACEDVGPADDVLSAFVVACATVYPPKKTGNKNYDLFCFLAEQMCDLATRSRIYCSYSLIELAAHKSEMPELAMGDKPIVEAIMQQKAAVLTAEAPRLAWLKKNDWRAEGMLRFVGLTLPLEMTMIQTPIPPFKMLFDLPSYCYDMHTRIGLKTLHRLVREVAAAEGIAEFFRQNEAKTPHKALGMALFFVEGGRIKGEMIYEPLCRLERNVIAHQFG